MARVGTVAVAKARCRARLRLYLSRRKEPLRIHRLQIDGGDEPRFSRARSRTRSSRSPNPRALRCATNEWRIFMNDEQLEPYSSSCLAGKEKCFRVRSFSTH